MQSERKRTAIYYWHLQQHRGTLTVDRKLQITVKKIEDGLLKSQDAPPHQS